MEFSLAPLRGITGKEFRTALTHHYDGVDTCVLPFFSITKESLPKFKNFTPGFTEEEISHKCNYLVIPQLIGNDPPAIARISQMLVDNGYPNVNLNLGCPMPQITKKRRGSGLLSHKDIVEEILNEVIKVEGLKFSLKVRLGLNSENEIINLIDVFNTYPVDEIIIHPRLGIDRYEGKIRLEILDKLINDFKYKIVYNGDITDIESFNMINKRYRNVDSFMIGRGLVANPALIEEIKTHEIIDKNLKLERFKEFYKELVSLLLKRTSDPVPRLKSYWQYFACNFDDYDAIFKQMVRSQSIDEMKNL
ncbi:tRNA-dihydrouridine synthase family protein [Bacteroidales bacterium OttesenSCG-928-K03]|nr:tRNA-dihydrouridine synthase family protein [Bacteroidales bacterium OttesenSCG-928-K03]